VILDLRMPGMDGRELLKIMAKDKRYSNLPILVVTGEQDGYTDTECLEMGAWDFVARPYNAAVIRLRLRNIIGRSQVYLMKRIHTLAEQDRLTGLYNREFFMEETKRMLLQNPDKKFVLVRMDIFNFRLFNSFFGTKAGDELLLKMARKIEEKRIPYETYGRIKSDVFCICAQYDKEQLELALHRAEEWSQGLCENYRIRFSFGLYVIEDRRLEMEKMYSCATEAARKNKKSVNNLFTYYNKKISVEEEQEQRLINQMDAALKSQQFQVYLQPKYSLETEKPCGAEALVRWIHPGRGIISPGEFIPVFEKNGQILQLDYYMWEKVCRLLHQWLLKMGKGGKLYPISVNISRISLYNPQIIQQLVSLTDTYRVPRQLLQLEITESAYMSNPDLMKDIIHQLREKGFVILMDDFGSGYSSLNTLKEIEVDILKIDMKFLPSDGHNVKNEKILTSVVRMAGWIGMPVIVEGVETKEQKDFLESIGCTCVQGFYYAKPMPVADYERLLERSLNRSVKEDEKQDRELNLDIIWASDSKSVTLLKSISIPFAIFEYSYSNMEVIRTNLAYTKEFGFGVPLRKHLQHREQVKLIAAMSQVVDNQSFAECECLYLMAEGKMKWYRVKLTYIGASMNSSLIGATFTNITTEKMLERELNTVFGALKEESVSRASLLVVDDQEVSREILKIIFEDEFDIITAADGKEALELLKQHTGQFAAILLDMIMPRMGGQEFLSIKNQMTGVADIPVVIISSEDDEKLQINMLQNGVNDYVIKPFVPATVRQRVHNVIEYRSRFQTLVREYQQANDRKTE
ncbi:MAG: EAL domain-containing protein, partial [Lachnospiraceae bacterium]|nr:EAL domain-containing protein [Lachnospiraceae bacterium]